MALGDCTFIPDKVQMLFSESQKAIEKRKGLPMNLLNESFWYYLYVEHWALFEIEWNLKDNNNYRKHFLL